MQLVEQHIIKDDRFKDWCIKAKNLYNQSLYYWRQSVFGNIQNFSEYELLGLFREFNEENYRQIPSHCGQEVLKNLFKNIQSWRAAKKEYDKNPEKFSGKPRMPKYKKEMSIFSFTNQQLRLKNGFIHFPEKMGIAPIKTNVPNINGGRIIPKSNHFVVEFVYKIQEPELKECNNKAMGIDLGLNNLATCITTTGDSFILNGRPLKSINQFYNKRKAEYKSKLPLLPKRFKTKTGNRIQVGTSKAIEKISLKRNNQIKNYIHHASKRIVEKAKELDITKIAIGDNKDWKQEINLGKKTNQNFVSIPHSTLIKTIEYKAKMTGIETITTEESYTSKCSAIDMEPIRKHETYVGKRVKRGLFRTADGLRVNADANGAANIMRKVIGDFRMDDLIVRAVIAPEKLLPIKQVAA